MLLCDTHKHVVGLFAYADVNECEDGRNGGCHEKRECTNKVGSMECEDCRDGWVNNGAKGCTGILASLAGNYYIGGSGSATQITCDGRMIWHYGGLTLNSPYPAGSRLPANRADQNDDPNYQASDGWFFRGWIRNTAWEFVRFHDGKMTVRHFCSEGRRYGCDIRSPEGSPLMHHDATVPRVPTPCAQGLCCDVNWCASENGGCHEQRECTNKPESAECGDCATGWTNDGAKGCRGKPLDYELGMGS